MYNLSSSAGRNIIRVNQLNTNVTTWARLLKRAAVPATTNEFRASDRRRTDHEIDPVEE